MQTTATAAAPEQARSELARLLRAVPDIAEDLGCREGCSDKQLTESLLKHDSPFAWLRSLGVNSGTASVASRLLKEAELSPKVRDIARSIEAKLTPVPRSSPARAPPGLRSEMASVPDGAYDWRREAPNGRVATQRASRFHLGQAVRVAFTEDGSRVAGVVTCVTPRGTAVMQATTAGGDGAAGPQLEARQPAEQIKFVKFFEETAGPCKQVVRAVWAALCKLVQDVKSYIFVFICMVCSMPGRAVRAVSSPKLHACVAEEDPEALAAVVFGAGGALCLGSVGGVVGAALGGTCGTALGAVPAIFTFGLSLPIGAAIGVLLGVGGGAAVGGGAGFTAGAASGALVAHFRGGIRRTLLYAASVVHAAYDFLVARPIDAAKHTAHRVRDIAACSVDFTKAKAVRGAQIVHGVASDRRAQASAAGAGAGAAALGVAGAAGGALVGGTVGAIVGLLPAVFTFGLSIPLGAVVGGGAGLIAGGVAGTTAGLVCGGGAGFLGYTYWEAPRYALAYVQGKSHAAAAAAGLVGGRAAAVAGNAAGAPAERAKAD